jgi:hypothetical protein
LFVRNSNNFVKKLFFNWFVWKMDIKIYRIRHKFIVMMNKLFENLQPCHMSLSRSLYQSMHNNKGLHSKPSIPTLFNKLWCLVAMALFTHNDVNTFTILLSSIIIKKGLTSPKTKKIHHYIKNTSLVWWIILLKFVQPNHLKMIFF